MIIFVEARASLKAGRSITESLTQTQSVTGDVGYAGFACKSRHTDHALIIGQQKQGYHACHEVMNVRIQIIKFIYIHHKIFKYIRISKYLQHTVLGLELGLSLAKI